MSDEIFFEGKRYISAFDAAKDAGFTRDYVACLCRTGRVLARRVGKNWFVEEKSIQKFQVNQGHQKALRQEALAEETRALFTKDAPLDTKAPGKSFASTPPRIPVAKAAALVTAPPTPIVSPIHTSELHTKLAKAVETTPSGFSSALMQSTHVPVYTVTPVIELLHKFIALALAFTLVFGTYAIVDPNYASFAERSMQDSISNTVRGFIAMRDTTRANIRTVPLQVVHGVAHPMQGAELASAGVASSFASLAELAASVARGVNTGVDGAIFALVYPLSTIASRAQPGVNARGDVTIKITGRAATTAPLAVNTSNTPSPTTVYSNAPTTHTVETHTIETQRVIELGGVSQDALTAQLQAVQDKLSAQMYKLASAQTTLVVPQNVAAGGSSVVYMSAPAAERINQLQGVTISDSSITGGSISGASIAATTLSASGATTLGGDTSIAGALTVNGAVNLATTTISNLTITGTSTLNNVYIASTFASSSIITNLNATNATSTNASSTNLYASLGFFDAATSTTFFSTLAHLSTGIVDTLSSTLATITGLTTTNSTSTNATSTNSFATNFVASNATTTSFYTSQGVFGAATTTNLYASNASINALSLGTLRLVGPANMLLAADSSGNVVATSTPTIDSIFATSTTATSTFAGAVNIGGGTSLDPSLVTISNTSGINPLEIHSANALGIDLFTHAAAAFRGPTLNLYKSRGTQSAPSAVQSGDNLAYLSFGGYDGAVYSTGAQMQPMAAENWTTGAHGTNLTFWTNSIGTLSLNQRMVLTSQGSLGIGTTSPDSTLSVVGTGHFTNNLTLDGSATQLNVNGLNNATITLNKNASNHSAGINFNQGGSNFAALTYNTAGNFVLQGPSSATTQILSGNSATLSLLAAANSILTFGTNNLERGRFDTAGNFGIGTTTPTTNFSVQGNGFFSGNVTLANLIATGTATFAGATTHTGLASFNLASTSQLSVFQNGYFGATATSTFNSLGQLSLVSNGLTVGSNQLVVSGGNVGIGTTSPSAGLDISVNPASTDALYWRNSTNGQIAGMLTGSGGTSAGALLLNNGSAVTTVRIDGKTGNANYINNGGNFGIGTTSPAYPLSVVSDSSGNALYLSGGNVGNIRPSILFDDPNQGSRWRLGQGISAFAGNSFGLKDEDAGVNVINVEDGSRANALTIRSTNAPGTVGIGTTTPWGNLSITGLGTGTGYTFVAADSSNAPKFVIQDNGNVGIGTTSPATKLEIDTTAGGGIGNFPVVRYNNSSTYWDAGVGATGSGTLAGKFYFSPNGGSGSMVIDTSGNVGIGTTSPQTLLGMQGGIGVNSSQLYLAASGRVGIGTANPNAGTLTIVGPSDNTGIRGLWANRANSGRDKEIAYFDGGSAGLVVYGGASAGAAMNISTNYGSSEVGLNLGTYSIPNILSLATTGVTSFTAGNVGIGTTSPATTFSIAGSSYLTGGLGVGQLNTTSGTLALASIVGSNGGYRLYNSGTLAGALRLSNSGYGVLDLNDTSGSTQIELHTNGASYLNGGNVGIGTTSPASKLDVYGNVSTGQYLDVGHSNGTNGLIRLWNTSGNTANIYNDSNLKIIAPTGGYTVYQGDYHLFQNTAGSTEYMRITNTGNVGIGTTSPVSKLSVVGESAFAGGGVFGLGYAGTAAPSNGLLVQGNVGIGTTGPDSLLNLFSSSGSNVDLALHLQNGSSFKRSIINFTNDGNNDGASLEWRNANYGTYPNSFVINTVSRPLYIANGGTAAMTITSGNVGIGTTSPASPLHLNGVFTLDNWSSGASRMDVRVSGASNAEFGYGPTGFGGTHNTGAYIMSNNDISLGAYGGSANVTIKNSGNVGIGTTSPSALLHLSYNTGATAGLKLTNTGTNGRTWSISEDGTLNNGTLTVVDSTASQTRMVINSSGNVGIGTTSPAYPLTIAAPVAQMQLHSTGANNAVVSFGFGSLPNTAIIGAGPANGIVVGQNPGDLGLAAYNRNILFSTANGGSSAQLVINSNGNVGIGTTTPQAALHVQSAGGAYFDTSAGNGIGLGVGLNPGIIGITGRGATTDLSIWGPRLNVGLNTAGGSNFNVAGNVSIGSGYAGTAAPSNGLLVQGNVGIGTTTPWANISVQNTYGSANNAIFAIASSTNSTGSTASTFFIVASSSNVGIGTTNPTAQLHTTGTVRFANFGAGSLQTDANGNVTVSSDERLKNINGQFSRGLQEVLALNPIVYHWNTISGLDQTTQYAGFSAQNVQSVIPEAVGTSSSGYLTLQDRPILAAVVNAVKELNQKISTISPTSAVAAAATPIASVSDMLAGLHAFGVDITLNLAHFVKIVADNLTVGSQSHPTGITMYDKVTGAPYCFEIANGDATTTPGACPDILPDTSVTTSSATTSPDAPQISIMGNNPATINIGSVYGDLGATITGPVADLNLGIHTFVDGIAMDVPLINTSSTGTHTIDYVVTDQNGLTATSTRTVNVIDPNAPTTTATSTDATTTNTTTATSTTTTNTTATTTSTTTTTSASSTTP